MQLHTGTARTMPCRTAQQQHISLAQQQHISLAAYGRQQQQGRKAAQQCASTTEEVRQCSSKARVDVLPSGILSSTAAQHAPCHAVPCHAVRACCAVGTREHRATQHSTAPARQLGTAMDDSTAARQRGSKAVRQQGSEAARRQ
jgi:hypothetical protein